MRFLDHILPVSDYRVALTNFKSPLLPQCYIFGNYFEAVVDMFFADHVSLGRQNSEAPETDTRLHHLVRLRVIIISKS